ncbi:hypothetical protein PMAYCL1PPCAC_10069, partial [Pristionchus mayeri]
RQKSPKKNFQVLDVPHIQDDFYMNLIDWSSQNVLAVALNECVYFWNPSNQQISVLCDIAYELDSITSVKWSENGEHLAVGTTNGMTKVFDVRALTLVHEIPGHCGRVFCLA